MKGPLLGAGAGAGLMALVMGFVVPQIQTFEGNSSTPYRDIGGVLTVCSGHTGPDSQKDLHRSRVRDTN
jgi:GH24 family phage-related lysozyme (muramidase)